MTLLTGAVPSSNTSETRVVFVSLLCSPILVQKKKSICFRSVKFCVALPFFITNTNRGLMTDRAGASAADATIAVFLRAP